MWKGDREKRRVICESSVQLASDAIFSFLAGGNKRKTTADAASTLLNLVCCCWCTTKHFNVQILSSLPCTLRKVAELPRISLSRPLLFAIPTAVPRVVQLIELPTACTHVLTQTAAMLPRVEKVIEYIYWRKVKLPNKGFSSLSVNIKYWQDAVFLRIWIIEKKKRIIRHSWKPGDGGLLEFSDYWIV